MRGEYEQKQKEHLIKTNIVEITMNKIQFIVASWNILLRMKKMTKKGLNNGKNDIFANHTIDKTGHGTAEKQIENCIDIRF